MLDATAASARTIVLLGPTAGGKSDLALELARRLGGELVSADSMQVYRGMDIGTAKPTAAERAEIPHHAIDLVDATDNGFTVASWLAEADRAIDSIRARGRVPIIVGGTNLYIRAFLEGLDEAPAADAEYRASLELSTSEALHAQLTALDLLARKHGTEGFATLPVAQRQELLRAVLRDQRGDRLPAPLDANHIAIALLAHWSAGPDAWDTALGARVSPGICRTLGEATRKPLPVTVEPRA